MRLEVNPIACTAHGLCAELLPELIPLDEWGYPILPGTIPIDLEGHARRAVRACPALALRITKAEAREHTERQRELDTRTEPQHRRPIAASGPDGNAHLTAMTGAVLLVGFAVEGATILELNRLLWLHFAVGFLLLGPVLLKICSTVYRFARYYTGSGPYVRKGPPAPLLRILGPLVILTSAAVLGTGVILAVVGPGQGNWLFLHKAAFVLWFGVMTVHVVAHAPRLPRLLLRRRDGGHPGRSTASGGPLRCLALGVALAVGVLVAALTTHLSSEWTGGFHLH